MILKSSNCFAISVVYCTLIILLFWGSIADAQQKKGETVSFYVYVDSAASLTFDEVTKPSFQSNFIKLESNEISFDITESAVWIRFVFTDSISDQRYIEITSPNIHQVEYFFPHTNEQYREYKVGFLENFERRPIQIDLMTFPTSAGKRPHYLRLKSDHFMNTRFEIREMEEVTRGAAVRELLFSLYDGLMMAIIAGVLFYIYLIRYYSYLFYIGYIIFISSINLTEKGFYFRFLWPNIPVINYYFPLLPFGVSFCMLLFLKSIWDKSTSVKLLYRFNFWVVTALPFTYVIYYLFEKEYRIAIMITQLHSFVVCLIIIVTSIISYLKSTQEHRRFFKLIIMGLCIFSLGVMIYLLSQNHILPINSFTENSILIGSTVEVCLFTTALIFHSDMIYRRQKSKFLQKNSF